jgi:hypothetical protein
VPDLGDDGGIAPAAHDLVEDRPGRVRPLVARGIGVDAGDPAEALDRVEDPRAAAEVGVEVEVAVRHDVETRSLLVADDGGDGVRELLAVPDVGETRRERPAVQTERVPAGTRPGSGNRRREDDVRGRREHRALFTAPGAPLSTAHVV